MGERGEPNVSTESEEIPQVEDLADALGLLKTDTSMLLKDLLKGVSMWAITAAMSLFLTVVWLVLAEVLLTFAHPYGSPPVILGILYLSYGFAIGTAVLGVVLFWRYYTLRKKYSKLFEISAKLR
jgi:hypothetical protein